jgi:hypothetical protein
MKINWLKIVVAVILIGGAIYWAVTSAQVSAYDGSTLAVDLGSGVVTVNNPTSEPVPAQLVGRGTRTFSITNASEGLAGTPERVGTGTTSTFVLDMMLLPGTNTFTVVRGAEVQLLTTAPTELTTTVQPISNDEIRTINIFAGVVILGALYLISSAFGHAWMKMLSPAAKGLVEGKPVVAVEGGQGTLASGYGDNRAQTPK